MHLDKRVRALDIGLAATDTIDRLSQFLLQRPEAPALDQLAPTNRRTSLGDDPLDRATDRDLPLEQISDGIDRNVRAFKG